MVANSAFRFIIRVIFDIAFVGRMDTVGSSNDSFRIIIDWVLKIPLIPSIGSTMGIKALVVRQLNVRTMVQDYDTSWGGMGYFSSCTMIFF